jgi:hypothetical protein
MVHSVLEASYRPNLRGRAQRKVEACNERICESSVKEDSANRPPKESGTELGRPRTIDGGKLGEYANEAERND